MTTESKHICPLSKNTIRDIFSLPLLDSNNQDINKILQIIKIKQVESNILSSSNIKQKIVYSATLRDMLEKYTSFVLVQIPSETVPLENDYIKINKINVNITQSNKKAFIIKSFNILLEHRGIDYNLSEPTLYNENDIIFHSDINHSSNTLQLNTKHIPLSQLTSFSKNFCILGRIILKTEIKEFKGATTQNGKLFSFSIRDKEGSEMEVTCFNRIADKFYDQIEKNGVYEITGGYVKINDKKFTNKSEYKIILDENSKVVKTVDTNEIVKNNEVHNKVVTIKDIATLNVYSIVDICCVILETGEREMMHTKNGDQYKKKIIIGDISGYKVSMSLWRSHSNYDLHTNDIILVRNVRILNYNGRNLSTIESTAIDINPNTTEVEKLKNFLNSNTEFIPLKNLLNQQKEENFDEHMKIYYLKDILDDTYADASIYSNYNNKPIPIKVTITQMTHDNKNYYMGCCDPECKKKVITQNNNNNKITYICTGCGAVYNKPAYYYSLMPRVKDCSREDWIKVFGKEAEDLMKISAEEYKNIIINNDVDKLNKLSENIEFNEYIFFIRPKAVLYGTNSKKRLYVSKIKHVDKSYYHSLLRNINRNIYHKKDDFLFYEDIFNF